MSKKHLIIVLLFALALLGGVCTGLLVSSEPEQMAQTSAAEEKTAPTVEEMPFVEIEPAVKTVSSEKYMVTLSDNKLFIYKITSDNLMEIIEEKEIDSNALRREDYEELFKGITVDTLTQAREIAEDYVG